MLMRARRLAADDASLRHRAFSPLRREANRPVGEISGPSRVYS
jgi:hypothetical protein